MESLWISCVSFPAGCLNLCPNRNQCKYLPTRNGLKHEPEKSVAALGPAPSASGPLHLLLSLQQLIISLSYIASGHICHAAISQTDMHVLGMC